MSCIKRHLSRARFGSKRMEKYFVMSRGRYSYYCPFCKQWAYYHGETVSQGRGKFKRIVYFHSECFEKAVKEKTYWNFKE